MRRAVACWIALLAAVVTTTDAHADHGGAHVSDGDGVIDTVISRPGSPGGSNPGSGDAGRGGIRPVAGGGTAPGGPTSSVPACSYTPVGYGGQTGLPAEMQPKDVGDTVETDGGAFYYRQCPGEAPGIVWVPDSTAGGAAAPPRGSLLAPIVTPGMLAQDIYKTLVLPAPQVGVNPDAATADGYTLVNLPTWWWVENAGQPLTQRTSLGPVWAEVTARPVGSSFDGGEGESAQWCDGPGVEWREGLSEEEPAACRYTYRRAAERYDATVTLHWQVSWVGSGGAGGSFPEMTTSTTVPMRVYERQAVVVSGRG